MRAGMQQKRGIIGITGGQFSETVILAQQIREKTPVPVGVIFVMLAVDNGIIRMNTDTAARNRAVSAFKFAVGTKNRSTGHIVQIIAAARFHYAEIFPGHSRAGKFKTAGKSGIGKSYGTAKKQ